MERLDRIMEACQWVNSKGAGTRDACKVTTRVRWANWDKKEFSPVMCVLWYSETRKEGNEYDTFWIPSPDAWIARVAHYLGTTEEWVKQFVDQCSNSSIRPWQWDLKVSFLESESGKVCRPQIVWEKVELPTTDVFPESIFCLKNYGDKVEDRQQVPYWTKNPPVELYENKLLSAVRDLFEARKAAGID
jgi:hypothetical protein